MFGFLRADARDRRYRQLYAGCCAHQHRQFGIGSLPLLSYEAVFLYVLAEDAGACPCPDRSDVTCCRLRQSGGRLHQVDTSLATFCSCFGLLLASIKLEDDIRDDGSLLARLALWRLRSRIERAKDFFERFEPSFRDRVRCYIDEHLRLERAGSHPTLDQYAEPTAEAFGYVFGLYARLFPGDWVNEPWLREIGSNVGRAIICFDCAVDWQRDRRRGRFNPLPDQESVSDALLASQRWLSHVGWKCSAIEPESHAASVVGATFERVQAHVCRAGSRTDSTSRRRGPKRPERRGDCDCLCDPSCCDGCDSCPDTAHTDACACFCPECDCCCDFGSRRSKKTRDNDQQPVQSTTRKGSVGRTLGPLNPAGVVLIDGQRVPARSHSRWIDAETEVEVVSDEAFGVIVRSREPGVG